jgi:hypothetical protein
MRPPRVTFWLLLAITAALAACVRYAWVMSPLHFLACGKRDHRFTGCTGPKVSRSSVIINSAKTANFGAAVYGVSILAAYIALAIFTILDGSPK